jgi:CyaY protein
MLDEARYQKLADATLRKIEGALGDFDPDDLDCELAGDVLTLTFKGKSKCIINTQRPTRQIWVAATARAWHFSYDEAKGVWISDKEPNVELFAQLVRIVKDGAGLDARFD